MSKFDPDKLLLVDCELVHHVYETHPMLRENAAIQGSGYLMYKGVLPIPEREAVLMYLKVDSSAVNGSRQILAKDLSYFRSVFTFDNYHDIVVLDSEGGVDSILPDALIAMMSITVSTVRGQLQVLQSTSAFQGLRLPVLSVKQIVEMPGFSLEEIVPTWYSTSPDSSEEE